MFQFCVLILLQNSITKLGVLQSADFDLCPKHCDSGKNPENVSVRISVKLCWSLRACGLCRKLFDSCVRVWPFHCMHSLHHSCRILGYCKSLWHTMAPWLVTQVIYLEFLTNINKLVRFFLSGGKKSKLLSRAKCLCQGKYKHGYHKVPACPPH